MALPPPKRVEIGAFYSVFGDQGILRRVGVHDPILPAPLIRVPA
jgi:hypothetical protein